MAGYFGCAFSARPQDQTPDVMWTSGNSQAAAGQERSSRAGQEGRGRPVFGKISAIRADSIEVTASDGSKVTLKLTSATEFRKDRQPAKASDLKVGDTVIVRTDQPDGRGTTALMVASGQGFGMRAGSGGPGGGPAMMGTLGKEYVVGEVRSVDPPRLTVVRTDNVTQTLELNEDTSLRRGRDSITMADIQPGDHVFARGTVDNKVFVPKNLNVIPQEMWKRLQEWNAGGAAVPTPATPPTPAAPPTAKNPSEPEN